MHILLAVTMAALVALASADVSHLGNYNYPAPVTSDSVSFTPKQTFTLSHSRAQIESIKPSIPLGSFTIHQNIGGQGNNYGSQGFSNGQSSGAYNYNPPQQQHFSTPVHHHSDSPVHQTFSTSAVGPAPRSYLPPAPQQQYHSATPVHSSLSVVAPVPVQQSYSAPASAPVHQQSYTAPASLPVLQQSFAAHSPAPVQQTHYSSAGQIQQQSFDFTGHQQQSFGGIESTNLAGDGSYNYQPPVQQQSFPASVPIQQGLIAPARAPVQQTYSLPANVHQQSFSTSTSAEEGSYNYQPAVAGQQSYSGPSAAPVQYSFPAHQAVIGSSGVESGAYNYQPPSQVQQQIQSVPPATPVQLAGLSDATGVDAGSLSYQGPASVPAAAPVSVAQGLEYSVPAQKISLPTPVTELTAPAPAPEVGTVYGENGGYVYSKF